MVKSKKEIFKAILVLMPSVVLLAVFVYGFILWTFRVSLSAWRGIVPDYTFVGFKNYIKVFQSVRFQTDMWNTFYFTILLLVFCISFALMLAHVLDKGVKFESTFRSVFLFPIALSFVVTGVVWRWIFNPEVGINVLIHKLGFKDFNFGWYTQPLRFLNFNVPLVSLLIAAGWQLTGYIMAMFLAGMRAIPQELRDAWVIDGAGELQAFWFVVLPILKPVILSAGILLGHMSLKLFTLVYNMTGQGPAFATDIPALNMFETTFAANRYGEGAMIAIALLLFVAVVIVPYLYSQFKSRGRTA